MNQNLTKLRPATQADAVQISELELQMFPDNAWNETTVGGQLEGGTSWVAEYQRRLVGYALIAKFDGIADLLRLAVVPEYQRQGLAGLLIAMSLANSPAVLTVKPDSPAVKLYRRHGFKVVGKIESAWVMRRL